MVGRRRYWRAATVGLVLFGAGLAAVEVSFEQWRAPTKVKWALVAIGDPEERVRAVLGQPEIAYSRGEAPADYYIHGYGRRKRPITGKVLIYRAADMVFYVWLGEDGKVEEVFRGTS